MNSEKQGNEQRLTIGRQIDFTLTSEEGVALALGLELAPELLR